MVPPVPIEAPPEFPTLAVLIERMQLAIGVPPHHRARAVSGWAHPESDVPPFVITHYDGVTVWEDDQGNRMVDPGSGEMMIQGEDGSWEATEFEGSARPTCSGSGRSAQEYAWSAISEGDPVARGHFLIVGQPTAHYSVEAPPDGFWNNTIWDVWVDDDGAVLRMIVSGSRDEDGVSPLLIWNVETLEPELQGPLPPS